MKRSMLCEFKDAHKKNIQRFFCTAKISIGYSLILNAALILIFHLFAALAVDVHFAAAIKSSVWYCMALLIPGAALHQLLLPKQQGFIAFSVLSYVFGYCYTILLYFIAVPLGLHTSMPFLTVLFTAAFLCLIIKNPKVDGFNLVKSDLFFIGFFFVYFVFCYIVFTGNIISPTITGSAQYHQDQIWWLENAIALSKDFPPSDLRIHGATLYYHYFASMQLAVANLATGIDIFTLSSVFSPLMKCVIFVGGLYTLLEVTVKNPCFRMFALLLLLICTGVESFSGVTYSSHIIFNPFGFDVGFGFGATALYLFYFQYKNPKKLDYRLLTALLLTTAVLAGVKAPIATITIAAMGLPCIVWFFSGKFKISLTYGIGLLVAFFGVSAVCAGLLDPELGRIGAFSMDNVIGISRLSQLFPMIPKPFLWPVCFAAKSFLTHPILILFLLFSGLYTIFNKKHQSLWNFSLLFSSVVGLLLGALNVQHGRSEMYFTMAAFLPAVVLDLRWLEQAWTSTNKHRLRITGCIMCGCFFIAQIGLFFTGGYGGNMAQHFINGWNNITVREPIKNDHVLDSIQCTDLEALVWIRDNTDKNSVLLADRGVVSNNPKYMYYGTFSERQMLLEGDEYYFHSKNSYLREEYVQLIFDVFANKEGSLEIAKDTGVTHIVQTKWLSPDFLPDKTLVSLVYESESIAVWELN